MKRTKKIFISTFTALVCMTAACFNSMAAVTYDPTGVSGSAFSMSADMVTVATKVVPGDRITGVPVYLGAENAAALAAEAQTSDETGLVFWENTSAAVYSVSLIQVPTGNQVQAVAEDGVTPLTDEAGNPVLTDEYTTAVQLNPTGEYAIEVSGAGASDVDTDGDGAPDNSYAVDAVDIALADGSTATVMPEAKYYAAGSAVTLTATDPEEGQQFAGWTVYAVDTDGNTTPVDAASMPDLASVGITAEVLLTNPLTFAMPASMDYVYLFQANYEAIPVEETSPETTLETAADGSALTPETAADGSVLTQETSADGSSAAAEAADAAAQNRETLDDAALSDVSETPAEDTAAQNPETSADGTQEAVVDENGVLQIGSDEPENSSDAANTVDLNPNALTITSSDEYTEDPEASTAVYSVTAADEGATVVPEGADAGSATNKAEDLTSGQTVTITAASIDGQKFVRWSASGIELDDDQLTAETLTINVADSDIILTGIYEPATDQTDAGEDQTAEAQDSGSEAQSAEEGSQLQLGMNTLSNANPLTLNAETGDTAGGTAESDAAATDGTASDGDSQVVEDTAPEVTVQVSGGTVTLTDTSEASSSVTTTDTASGVLSASIQDDSQQFAGWTSDNEAVTITNADSADAATVTVDTSKVTEDTTVTVTATTTTKQVTTTVVNGSGSGTSDYKSSGHELTANAAAEGTTFKEWVIKSGDATVYDPTSAATTYTAGTGESVIEAVYDSITYTLTVNSGSGSGTYKAGDVVTVTAGEAQKGYQFSGWTLTSGAGTIANASQATTTVTMGAQNTVITANYELIPYTLTVTYGSGDGTYTIGTKVDISANFPDEGKEFDHWEKVSGKGKIADKSSYDTTVKIKASDVEVRAVYRDGPSADSNAITGLENGAQYLKGETLTFTAVGAGPDKDTPSPGDYKYVPTGYKIGSVAGSWTGSPYTTSMAINATGDYTLSVTFEKYMYDGASWNAEGTVDTKSITFHVVAAKSAETGDNSPILPLVGAAAGALVLIIILAAIKRRKK